jgi:hypothetical protein
LPALVDTRLEAFAQAIATGLSCREAQKKAGYADSGRGSKYHSERTDVVARVAELVRRAIWGGTSDLAPAIDALAAVGEAAQALGSAAALREAKGAYSEAARLKRLLPPSAPPPAAMPDMTREEWLATFAPRP